ncbi:restriction endonuclease subunit S [Fusobacterium polymorphum]|uniref:Restriction endonuclease subunit S n=1 Tax=Fusobacterium nucleatum subsp. polymorphum TaxID=76857 RepID=A0A1Z3CIZ9_FUSNP|nr:restriction endonuclease subunit S [Fusobacterium polymorphum]ASC03599.1 restriction endonuclease subunit S [Fusobacterium polymorphum]
MAKNKKVEISLEEKLEKALIPVEEQAYKIPDNWVWTRLGEIVVLDNGENIENEELDYFDVKTLRRNLDVDIVVEKKTSGRIVEKNDLVILVDGENSGEVFKIPYRGYMGSTFKKLKYSKEEMWNYISMFLKRNKEIFKNNKVGSAIPHLNKKLFKEFPFPLPPLNEQKRIVEKLDFLFDKTEKVKEIIEEIKVDIENRKISILDRAFKGILTSKWRNENKVSDVKELLKSINDEKIKKWEEDCLQAEKEGKKKPKKLIIREVEDMIVPTEEQPYKLPDSWVWVRLGEVVEVNPNKIKIDIGENELVDFIPMKNVSESSPKIIEKNFEKFKDLQKGYTQFIKNDILFAKITPCMENGKTAIISDLKEKIGYGSTEFHILRSTKIINNKLLYNFLKQKGFREDARYNMTGSVGFRRVPTEFMKSYPFPLPPLEEQQEIVRILDEVLENENKVKELLELEERIDVLEKSILNKAFKGELGTQNSSDEPAIELLKEIL